MNRDNPITFIVPTLGRASLINTLRSIELWPDDEIIVIGNVNETIVEHENGSRTRYVAREKGNDWGHSERNAAMPMVRTPYMAHIDDDDLFDYGTRALMADAIKQAPGRPTIFRMRFPNGITLWAEPVIRCGNLGTPCFLIPNQPEMLGTWGSFVGGDCWFLETSKWKPEDYNWREEVIALLHHNAGEAVAAAPLSTISAELIEKLRRR